MMAKELDKMVRKMREFRGKIERRYCKWERESAGRML